MQLDVDEAFARLFLFFRYDRRLATLPDAGLAGICYDMLETIVDDTDVGDLPEDTYDIPDTVMSKLSDLGAIADAR